MSGRFLAVSVVLASVLTLLFAGVVGAKEKMTEETAMLAADSGRGGVEVKTSNVTVKREDGNVSVQTSNTSVSNQTGADASSMKVSQNQATQGRGSQAAASDVDASAQTSTITAGTPAEGSNPDSPSSPPDLITIKASGCTVDQGASITVEDGDGTRARFVDGQQGVEIRAEAAEVRIEGPNNDFIGDHAVSKSDPGFDTDGDYRVVATSGITTCKVGAAGNGKKNGDPQSAADKQYHKNGEIINIPKKGTLGNTGGMPLAGIVFFTLAFVGLGLAMLRFAIRRDQ